MIVYGRLFPYTTLTD